MKNKLNRYLIACCLMLGWISPTFAQQTNSTPPLLCPVNGINTDPNNPVDSRNEPFIN
jgi:hypothetical protein